MKNLILCSLLVSMSSYAKFYVVKTNSVLNKVQKEEIKKISGSYIVNQFFLGAKGEMAATYEIDSELADIDSKLKKLAYVKNVATDHNVSAYEIRPNPKSEMTSDDILFPLLWGLQSQDQIISTQRANGGPVAINAKQGNDINWAGVIDKVEASLKKTPVVAVIDMGIDLAHPELKDQIYKNDIECDDGEVQTGKREDRDKNGLFGDCLGWNFAATSRLYEALPFDDKGHGTHVSGIIAAKRNNNQGIAGVSDKIKILPIRVTGRIDETKDRQKIMYRAASRRIAKAIYYAATRGVDVINLSLGWPKGMNTFYMKQAIGYAISKKVLIVAAAGNDNTNADVYPCAFKDVICVGSVDADGSYSRFSNYGGQVDILAPGNQILSTIPTGFIPLKMNVQGYDIMSGTSQAAPYVAAVAALVRASFPEESIDSIKRRLLDSALSAPSSDKSMHGIVQLGAAMDITPAASVKPVFKDLNELIINGKNFVSFKQPLFLKNYGTAALDTKVRLISLNKEIVFTQNEFLIKEIAEGKAYGIPLELKVLNKYTSNQFKFTVEIANGEEVKAYTHELSLSKALLTHDNKEVLPVRLLKRDNPHSLIAMRTEFSDVQENRYNTDDRFTKTNFRTIREVYPTGSTSYYLSFTPKDTKDTHQVFLFEQKNGAVVENKTMLEYKNTRQVLSVEKMDFNYDGVEDIMVRTIGVFDDSTLKMSFHYYDNELKPLYKKSSRFDYFIKKGSIQINNESIRYVKTKLTKKESIALPIFATVASLPKELQTLGPWDRPDYSQKNRVFTFEIEIEKEQRTLKIKNVLDSKLSESLQDSFSSSLLSSLALDDAAAEVVALDHQTKDEFYANTINIKLSFGVGFQRSIINAEVIDEKVSYSILKKVRSNLLGSNLHPAFDLDENKKYGVNAYVNFFTNSDILISHIEGGVETKHNYKLNTPDDRLVSFIASFKSNDSAYLFFETIDNILMIEKKDGITKESTVRTKKFSFLPGKVMSDLFYPVTVKTGDGKIPGIYIDNSSVSINRIYTMVAMNGKLRSPLELSFNLPQICGYEDKYCGLKKETNHFATNFCMPLNPTENKYGNFSYTALCKYKDSYQLVKITVQL